MTHVNYIECDTCHRTMTGGFMSELKDGDLLHDGPGRHICKDCLIDPTRKPATPRAGGRRAR